MLTILFCKLETPKIVVFAKKRDYQESLQVILIQNSSSIQPTPLTQIFILKGENENKIAYLSGKLVKSELKNTCTTASFSQNIIIYWFSINPHIHIKLL